MYKLLIKKLSNSKVSFRDTIIFVIYRGVIPALRGAFFKIFHLDFKLNLLFLGKGVSLIHYNKLKYGSNFYLGDYSYINCLSSEGVICGENVTIREFGWLQLSSSLDNPGVKIIIGDNTYLGPRCNLGAAAPLIIGSKCQIGAGVSFIAENHKFSLSDDIYDQGVTRKGIIVGDDCWIGNNVVVLDGVTIGRGTVIGAGSIVTKNIPDYSVAIGVPARVIKNRKGDE